MAPILPLCVLEFSDSVNVGTFHASYARQHLHRTTHQIIKRWQQRPHGNIAVSPTARRHDNNTFPADYEINPNRNDFKQFPAKVAPTPQTKDGMTNNLFVASMDQRKEPLNPVTAYAPPK